MVGDVNYPAVLVAAVATFLLGGLWYSPLLFGRQWVKAHGYGEEQVKAMQKGAGKAYLGSFAAYLVMAWVLANLVGMTGAATAVEGAVLGLLCWLGFAATIGLTSHLFSERRPAAYLLDAGYQLCYLLVQGVVLATWH